MNLSDRRSLEVSRAVVRELDRNPDAVLNKRANEHRPVEG